MNFPGSWLTDRARRLFRWEEHMDMCVPVLVCVVRGDRTDGQSQGQGRWRVPREGTGGQNQLSHSTGR